MKITSNQYTLTLTPDQFNRVEHVLTGWIKTNEDLNARLIANGATARADLRNHNVLIIQDILLQLQIQRHQQKNRKK